MAKLFTLSRAAPAVADTPQLAEEQPLTLANFAGLATCPVPLRRSSSRASLSCSLSSSIKCSAPRRPFYISNAIGHHGYVSMFGAYLTHGEQSPFATLATKEKLDTARQLARLGVTSIEAGCPVASLDDRQAVKLIAREVGIDISPQDADRSDTHFLHQILEEGNQASGITMNIPDMVYTHPGGVGELIAKLKVKAKGVDKLIVPTHFQNNSDARTGYLHRISGTLEVACAYVLRRQPEMNARIFASLDSGDGKTDDARKALEQMFQGKTSLSKKWEEEIQKRELGGRDGSGSSGGKGGGRGWGGGGDDVDDDFGGQEEPWDWEEAGQTFIATTVLIIFYFSITHGPKQVFRLFRLFFRWVRQGFTLRRIPREYLEGPDTEDDEEEDGNSEDYFDDKRLSIEQPYEPISDAQTSHVQNHHEPQNEVETETISDDSYLAEPSAEYKKLNRRAILEAQQKEKMMQILLDRDRRERGK